jgi:hypothetical protein
MRPTFVVSLDEELIWGSFDHTSVAAWSAANPDPRGIVRELLHLFDEYELPATWAIVGHLFLRSCARGSDGRAHPEIDRPRYSWYPRDWLSADPCTDRERDPLFYGDDLVDLVSAARARHEIASHSFSHIVFGDPGCSERAARSDLAECVRLARERGITLRSFVFPRNLEGHHALLREHGLVAYRGEEPNWYRGLSGGLKRGAHFVDQAAAMEPPVSLPEETLPGLWNVPGSMLFLHRGGMRKLIRLEARVAKAKAGLARAVRERKVFHLWFHPFNLSQDRAGMFSALRAVLADAASLRMRGLLDIRTMAEVADEMASRTKVA